MLQPEKGMRRHPSTRRALFKRRCLGIAAAAVFLLAAPSGPAAALGGADGDVLRPPVDLDVGFDARIRDVTLHNLLDLDTATESGPPSDAHFFRIRCRINADLIHRSGICLSARFTTEWRKYLDPYLSPEKAEIILDNFYVDIPALPYVPLSLRIGRQDLVRGEGFVLLEGGPNDGSRSIYQNAVTLGADGAVFGLQQTEIDVFAIRNLVKDGFVIANDRDFWLRNEDETAFGLYVTHFGSAAKNETYYIYKEQDFVYKEHDFVSKDIDSEPGTDARLHTLGTRMSGEIPWRLSFAAEGALQFGHHDDAETGVKISNHKAYGIHGWLSRSFFALFGPSIKIGTVFLSGDDAKTNENESWNPIYSRWPMWSELYIYTLIPEENRVAYWTNLFSLNMQVGLALSGSTELTYTFHNLRAIHPMPEDRQVAPYGSGKDRGDIHAWRLSAKLSDSISGHFLLERFVPGDFYNVPKDDAYFIRWELMVRI